MALPSFLIVGAPNSGTTFLHHCLSRHPQIAMSSFKEPRYFAYRGRRPSHAGPGDAEWCRTIVTERSAYEALFEGGESAKMVGESSTDYLYLDGVADTVAAAAAEMRIVIVLREPVRRSYSNYLFHRRGGREQRSFEMAIAEEGARIEANWAPWWHVVQRSRYASQVERYLAAFPREHILVLRFEHLARSGDRELRKLLTFLGVDPSVPIHVEKRYNAARREPRNASAERLRSGLLPLARVAREWIPARWRHSLRYRFDLATLREPAPSAEAVRLLREVFSEDLARLEALLGESFDGWRRRWQESSA